VAGYRLTVRSRSKLERHRLDSFDRALAELEERGRELERDARAGPVNTKLLGRYEPAQQVTARLELSGPGRLRAGLDVRGDGSVEAYTGRVRRRRVELRGSESAYDALRRAASPDAG
jgi:hypothetical protein